MTAMNPEDKKTEKIPAAPPAREAVVTGPIEGTVAAPGPAAAATRPRPSGPRPYGRGPHSGRSGPGGPGGRSRGRKGARPLRRKSCRFCQDHLDSVDYKNVTLLRSFMTERGKILASLTTGVCAGHQRQLTIALKRARVLALLPYSAG